MAQDSTMILESSKSGKKHTHKSHHLDSDKEPTNMLEHSEMESSQEKEVVVSSPFLHGNLSRWIDAQKRKGKREKAMYNPRT